MSRPGQVSNRLPTGHAKHQWLASAKLAKGCCQTSYEDPAASTIKQVTHIHVSGCAHDVVRDHAAQQLDDGFEGRLGRRRDLPIPAL